MVAAEVSGSAFPLRESNVPAILPRLAARGGARSAGLARRLDGLYAFVFLDHWLGLRDFLGLIFSSTDGVFGFLSKALFGQT